MNDSPTRPDLHGRVALVTGASRGIGQAVAVALARAGARCIMVARTTGGLERTDDLIRQHTGQGAILLPLDLTDGDRLDTLGPSVAAGEGGLDILVHCAGELGVLSPCPISGHRIWPPPCRPAP